MPKTIKVPYPKNTTVLYINGQELFLNHDEKMALVIGLAVAKPRAVYNRGCQEYVDALVTLKAKLAKAYE